MNSASAAPRTIDTFFAPEVMACAFPLLPGSTRYAAWYAARAPNETALRLPHPDRLLLLHLLEARLELIDRLLDLRHQHILERPRAALGAPVIEAQALQVAGEGGEPGGLAHQRGEQIATPPGLGRGMLRFRGPTELAMKRGVQQPDTEQHAPVDSHLGVLHGHGRIDLHAVEAVAGDRGLERLGGGGEPLLKDAPGVFVTPQLLQHLGRQDQALLVEELVTFAHRLPLLVELQHRRARGGDVIHGASRGKNLKPQMNADERRFKTRSCCFSFFVFICVYLRSSAVPRSYFTIIPRCVLRSAHRSADGARPSAARAGCARRLPCSHRACAGPTGSPAPARSAARIRDSGGRSRSDPPRRRPPPGCAPAPRARRRRRAGPRAPGGRRGCSLRRCRPSSGARGSAGPRPAGRTPA